MKPESWVKAVKAFRRGLSLRESAMVGGVTVEELGERMVELEGARAEVKGELLEKLIEMGMGRIGYVLKNPIIPIYILTHLVLYILMQSGNILKVI